MAEPDKKRKSRPKSEVVKSGSVTNEKRSHKSSSKTDADAPSKRSHSHKSKSHHVSSKPSADDLRREVEAARAEIAQLNERVAALNTEKEELAAKAGKGSASSSSSSDSDGAALDGLKSQLEEEKASVASLQQQNAGLQGLQGEIAELREENGKKDKALEAEHTKFRDLQNQVQTLSDKLANLEKENEELKSRAPSSAHAQALTSPRGGGSDGSNIPAWKLREMERQKEAEEQREREQRAKLQKVQSLRSVRNEVIVTEPIVSNFKDPVLNKPNPHHGGVIDDSSKPEGPLIASDNQTEEEKIAAEMARMNRTLKKGGHQAV
jgi:predicted  nucleic acid-binding Zn-ribbon protein